MRMKMKKKDFVQLLFEKYGPVGYNTTREEGKPITLYYEILNTPDEDGLMDRHCGTWMSGECWEFPRTHEQ